MSSLGLASIDTDNGVNGNVNGNEYSETQGNDIAMLGFFLCTEGEQTKERR